MQPVGSTKIHGGGEYSKVIFKKLVEQNKVNDITLVYSDKEYMPEDILSYQSVNYLKCDGYVDIEKILRNTVYDIFYSGIPYVYKDLKVPLHTKFIYTVHGLRYLEKPTDKYEPIYCKGKGKIKAKIKRIIYTVNPLFFRNKGWNEINNLLNATNNRTIITVSNHSKYSMMNFFPDLNVDEINVCYSPDTGKTITDEMDKINTKYILLISGDRWMKNNYRAVIAIDELYSSRYRCMKDIKTIVLGVADDSIYKRKIKNKNSFLFKGYVDKSELEIYEKNAHLFVYPTLNEGFGYPPLDAMKYGTVCACSAVTSVTEICGDAVLYFNPYDIAEIKNRILQSFDEDIRKEITSKIYEQYNYVKQRQVQDLDKLVNIILGGVI